jgi:hypothetical protein
MPYVQKTDTEASLVFAAQLCAVGAPQAALETVDVNFVGEN